MKEITHLVKGLDPVEDAFDGTVSSDIVSMKNYGYVEFVIYKGAGDTGTSAITVEACDDVSATNTTDIEFKYQAITSDDTHGSITDATTTGFTTSAGGSQLYRVMVDASQLADTGYEFVRVTATEDANGPVVGAILIILKEGRYETETPETALS